MGPDEKPLRTDFPTSEPRLKHPILRYFEYGHLTTKLQEVSKPFCELAHKLDLILPDGPEKSVALRKLLEGKDAAVRSALDI